MALIKAVRLTVEEAEVVERRLAKEGRTANSVIRELLVDWACAQPRPRPIPPKPPRPAPVAEVLTMDEIVAADKARLVEMLKEEGK